MNTMGDVFELSTDAVFGIDQQGVIRYVNTAFERLLGYSAEQLYGCRCWRVLCGTDIGGQAFCGPDCPVRSFNGNADVCDFDLMVRRADGDYLLVNIGASYIPHTRQANFADVAVFFSMRQVKPQRMLQRMAMAQPGSSLISDHHRSCQLTSREREILGLAAKGMTTSQIASHLFVSPQTVRSHFKNIYPKLGVNSRTEAVIYAMQNGLQ